MLINAISNVNKLVGKRFRKNGELLEDKNFILHADKKCERCLYSFKMLYQRFQRLKVFENKSLMIYACV